MTPDQSALFKKAQDSIRAAQVLVEQKLYDVAISRAYYTMFYIAEALLLGKGLVYSKHTAVIAAFGKQFHDSTDIPAEFHRYLLDAQDSRIAGDYDSHSEFSEDDALLQIQRAKEFLKLSEKVMNR